MPGRKFSIGSEYRYGFQNQETDPEFWGGAIFYKYRVEDPRLGKFFSVDPLAADYPHNSPYAFAENRVTDGVELEGLEWASIKDKEGNIIDYRWTGYDHNGNAKPGTVSSASLDKEVYTPGGIMKFSINFSSDSKAKSGHIDIYSKEKKVYSSELNLVTDYSALFNYSIDIKRIGGTTNWQENIKISYKAYNVSEELDLITGRFYSRYNDAYNSYSISDEGNRHLSSMNILRGIKNRFHLVHIVPTYITAVYPESICVPIAPKGLGMLSRAEASFVSKTGGLKQWIRIGKSYSVAGQVHTYGLRWGASPRYANKIGSPILRDLNQKLRNMKIPGVWWNTIDPGHFHFWLK